MSKIIKQRAVIFFGATLLVACSKKTSDSQHCDDVATCPAGQVCVQGACAFVCNWDRDCPGANICSGGICRDGARDQPTITGVDGTGSPDGKPGHAPRHFTDTLVIAGSNLEGAAPSLFNANNGFELQHVPSLSSNSTLTVKLPSTLNEGQYTLRVANQAGSAQSEVFILRGAPGEAGQDGTDGKHWDEASDEELAARINSIVSALDLVPTLAGRRIRVPLDLRAFLPDVGPTWSGSELNNRLWEFASERNLRRPDSDMRPQVYLQLPIPSGARISDVYIRATSGDADCKPTAEIVKFFSEDAQSSCGKLRLAEASEVLRFNKTATASLAEWEASACDEPATSTGSYTTNLSYYAVLSLSDGDGAACATTNSGFQYAWLEYEFYDETSGE